MPILTAGDAAYFPGVTLTGNDLLSAIRSAQALAESPKGANRPLEVQQYVEKHEVGPTRSFFVGKLPVLPSPTIRIRSRGYSSWGRVITPGSWFTLQAGQYEIDQRTGEITVFVNSAGFSYQGASSAYRDWSGAPGSPPEEVEITYSSGYVFTEPTTGDALTIKQAVADILKASQSSGYSQGISRYTQQRVYDVEFTGVLPAMDNALTILQKFAPRGI